MGLKKHISYLLVLMFLGIHGVFAQNPKLADSLIKAYDSNTYKGNELVVLSDITKNLIDPEKKLEYSELLINKASKDSIFTFLRNGYLQKGNSHQLQGNYVEALNSFFESLKFSYRVNDVSGTGGAIISIADTYSMIGNSTTAEEYYTKGIEILRSTSDSTMLATALLNAGDDYFNNKKYDEALKNFEESGIIFRKKNYLQGTAYNLGNVGMVYAEQGKDELAKKNINEAIAILEELKDYYPISVYLTYIADIYAKQNNIPEAIEFAERSLELASLYGLKTQISDSNLKLAELNEKIGNYTDAYHFYRDHISFRDSITNVEKVQQMAELRTDFELSQKQTEFNLLAQQKKTQQIIFIATSIALFLIILLAIGLYRRNRFIKRTSNIIEAEKGRSDELLLNILPQETAQELKDFGKVKSRRFESVTVMFTDFKNFTQASENMSPEVIVESVDFYFSKFDEIIEKYDLEKIKTIGDSYMCAGGLPFPLEDHAFKILLAALEIAEFVKVNSSRDNKYKIPFEVRIGVNTGAVVAGVVGKKKFAYDVWGDTVNIASRMESNSESGCINISENTYQLVKDYFNCEYRGKIQVKNKGMMKMYYVISLKDHLNLINTLEGYEISEKSNNI